MAEFSVAEFWSGPEPCKDKSCKEDSGQRILVLCEPNEEGQSQIVSLLTDLNKRLFLAQRADQALEILWHEEIHLIVSAVHLEESDAYDFLTTVKGDMRLHEIPFVFICLPGTQVARHINHTLELAANALGATKYLSTEEKSKALIQEEILSCLQERQSPARLPVPSIS